MYPETYIHFTGDNDKLWSCSS